MKKQIIKTYIEEYKRNFDRVHDQEIYKWKAIKQFQDNFDINSTDFYSNLEMSLSKAGNLLASGQYFPKIMLLKNTKQSPEQVREMFKILFDEEFDLLERVENYRSDFKALNKQNFDNQNHYQDHRAIIVYLTLYYPERYFLYKYQMFKDFADKVELIKKPVSGRIENIGQYQNLCELIRYEIENDQELLNLHEKRLDQECYRDINHNILTQDFIYAVVRHLDRPVSEPESKIQATKISEINASELKTRTEEIDFTPNITNHIQNNKINKRLGDLGEHWVFELEIEYLTKNGKQNLVKDVEHVANTQGDGLGFDILSFDLNGDKKYIEVKTTKGNMNSTFYVTRNELERSKIEKDKFFLYRVYDFDENNNTAKLLKIQGELTTICNTPLNYKVNLKK